MNQAIMRTENAMLSSQILIGDDLRDTGSAGVVEHRYPATGEINGIVNMGGKQEIDEAVAQAKQAAVRWRALPPSERGRLIGRLADVVEAWAEDFRALSAAETAMPGRLFSVRHKGAVEWIRSYQGYADKIGGDVTASSNSGRLEFTRHEPYGVIGVIITWNVALLSLTMKVPAALIAGNTVVVKPSEITPYTAVLFGKACLEAGIPPGVVNIVPGGGDAGKALVAHEDVDKISFTGGTSTAARMMETGAPLIKPFCFELGGKSSRLIFPDADIEAAAKAATAYLANAGQSCRLSSRIFVHDDVYEDTKAAFVKAMGELVVGSPNDDRTTMGPLVNAAAQERVLGFIQSAVDQNHGKLVLGGKAPKMAAPLDSGYFVEPTLFEDVDPASPLAQDELFGPVLSLFRFSDEAEAVEMANATRYGLANYVHTRDLDLAIRLSAQLKSGMVYVNNATTTNPAAPFGGWGLSGMGYEGGRAGLDEYLRKKTVGLA